MAAVTGPLSTLPGASHSVPAGMVCDNHPEVVATHRVQGETDSFGSELHDLCGECYEEHKSSLAAYRAEQACGTCEWCSNAATDLRQRRDFEEGMAGRLYMVCGACVKRENDELAEELEANSDDSWTERDLDLDSDDADNYEASDVYDVEGPLLPLQAMGPSTQPRAYVDGVFIY